MINGMLYYRGHRKDYDEWEELGNPGWGWKSVLPFFKSAEKWRGATNPNATYGTEGRFNIMYSPFRFKVDLLKQQIKMVKQICFLALSPCVNISVD